MLWNGKSSSSNLKGEKLQVLDLGVDTDANDVVSFECHGHLIVLELSEDGVLLAVTLLDVHQLIVTLQGNGGLSTKYSYN